jgi:hypothetical protein
MKYEYATIPVSLMHECSTVPLEDGAFVSEGLHAAKVRELLAGGFRWVRTEGEVAILERETDALHSLHNDQAQTTPSKP